MNIMSTNYEYRPGPTRNKYGALAKHLEEHPGVWALVRTAETEAGAWAAAHQIKTGRRAAFRPAGHYDAYSNGLEVIARYTGACHTSPLPTGGYCTACGTVDTEGA